MLKRNLQYDLNFFYSNPRIQINFIYISDMFYLSDSLQLILNQIDLYSKKYNKFYIVFPHEILRNYNFFFKIKEKVDFLNDGQHEVYLSMTTTTENDIFLHPLTSLLHYNDFKKIKNGFNLNSETTKNKLIYLGDLSLYDGDVEKTNKSILSIRRKSETRDYLNFKINKDFDGIYRYLNDDAINYKKAPTFTSLINEYKSSYISFLVETEYSPELNLNTFTEKSIIAFASKTLPIIFLQNETQLEEFESQGFYLLNRELGYVNVYNDMSMKETVDLFVKYIDVINKMDIKYLIDLYEKNLNKIENNYKLLENVLLKNFGTYNHESFIFKKPF
jgi:hypothetical protein